MWKWILLIAFVLSGAATPPVAAANSIDISVDIPLNGEVKYNQWSRINVTLTNHDAPFEGSVAIYLSRNAGGESNKLLSQPVSLAEGESKPYAFDLWGDVLASYSLDVKVLDKKGEEVARQAIMGGRPLDGVVVAVLADEPNAFHFLAINNERLRSSRVSSLTVQHYAPKDIPEQSWVLKNVDILAVSGSVVELLNDKQLAAIEEWVQRGGVLLLSAGVGQEATVQPFADRFSLPPAMPGETRELGQLQEIAGEDPLPVSAIPVYNRDLPLVSAKQAGAGLLLFANYDVTAEPLASWQYNREWWQHLLTRHGVLDLVLQSRGALLFGGAFSKMIPGVNPPDARSLFIIWLVYVLVVSPLLYFVLKRLDRREWAWGVIPALAVLFSIGIFTVGRAQIAEDNTSYTVSQIEIIDESLAEVTATGSFLNISGGAYEVKAAPGFIVSVFTGYIGDMSENAATLTREADETTRIVLERVPYLTIKQIATAGIKRDIGAFAANLTVEDNRLRGTITNNTAFDIEELYVNLVTQRMSLGAIKKGETISVDEPIEAILKETNDKFFYRGTTREELIEQLRKDLLNVSTTNGIRLLAATTQPLELLRMQDEHVAHYYNVLSQSVQLQPNAAGRIVYPYGMLPVRVVVEDGNVSLISDHAYELMEGSVTFALPVGDADITVKRLEVPLDLSPYRPFVKEIYHAASDTWLPLEREQRVVLEEELGDYLNRDGELLIRFRNPSDLPLELPEPLFIVEGEVRER